MIQRLGVLPADSPCGFERSAFTHDDGSACQLPPFDLHGHAYVYAHPCPPAAMRDHRLDVLHVHWCLPAAEAEGIAADSLGAFLASSVVAGEAGLSTDCPDKPMPPCCAAARTPVMRWDPLTGAEMQHPRAVTTTTDQDV